MRVHHGQNKHWLFFFWSSIHASSPFSFICFMFSTVRLWWAIPSWLNSFKSEHGKSLHWKQYLIPLFFAQSIILQSELQWRGSGPLQPSHLTSSSLTFSFLSFLNHSTISSLSVLSPWSAWYMSHTAQLRPQIEIVHFLELSDVNFQPLFPSCFSLSMVWLLLNSIACGRNCWTRNHWCARTFFYPNIYARTSRTISHIGKFNGSGRITFFLTENPYFL